MATMFESLDVTILGITPPPRDPHHRDFAIVSLSVSLASLVATVISFYWFAKMRRSFRHDLIMLLIQSDFLKSLWFMIYPIVSLTRKDRIRSDSAFCQTSGFFLALGIEASDVAVLLIAIHSGLYFLWPRRAGGGNGLYPYRHFAYAFYVVVPLIMASLAFVKGVPGYVDTGVYCYLPNHPKWYRMALSWAPRYVNFIILIAIYSCIYIYARILMRRYSRRSSSAMVTAPNNNEQQDQVRASQNSSRQGSISKPSTFHQDSSTGGRRMDRLCESIRQPKAMFKGRMASLGGPDGDGTIPWRMPNFQQDAQGIARKTQDVSPDDSDQPSPTLEPLVPIHPRDQSRRVSLDSDLIPDSLGSSIREGFGISRKGTSITSLHDHSWISTPLLPLSTDGLDPEGIVRNRDKIRRQLRLLFLYPLVYMLIWVMPFVSDVMRYRDTVNYHGPFGMRLATLISLSIHGLANSAVFALREHPWRYARGSFWANIASWFRNSLIIGRRRTPGRTRDEMFDEARIARQRRDDEAEHERVIRQTTGGASLRQNGRRNWWDRDLRGSSDWTDDEDETGMVDWGNGLKGSGIPAEARV